MWYYYAGAAVLLLLIIITAAGIFLFRFGIVRNSEKKEARRPPLEENKSFGKYAPMIREGIEYFLSMSPEIIERRSYDGLKLKAYYLPADNPVGTLILMHGYRGGMVDFGCVFRFYHELGYNILFPCERSHGLSEGRYICFGIKERYDCLGWINYVKERFDGRENNIFLDGISMGATVVMMTAGFDLPPEVRGIIADCGFTSPWEIFRHVLKSWFHLPPFPMLYITDIIARIAARFGFREYSTITAMKNCRIPVLFVHGDADDFVPTRMSRENYEACASEKQLIIVKDAGHGQSYLLETDRCRRALIDFLGKHTVHSQI